MAKVKFEVDGQGNFSYPENRAVVAKPDEDIEWECTSHDDFRVVDVKPPCQQQNYDGNNRKAQGKIDAKTVPDPTRAYKYSLEVGAYEDDPWIIVI